MKYKANTRRRALEYEKDWVQRWKADRTFEKSVENRPIDNSYVFYDGPPFISGVPHHGTLLSSIVKDAIPRYQTMKGKRVERVWGWDCHGLPAERYTEKKLGIKSREEVIEYGIEKYIIACRENMVQTSSEWETTVDRIGRWVDFQGAYKTMDKGYMESVWWAFKTLYEKGKIYEGEKVLMYCTLDATPLSKAEVTMDAGAYQDVTDPSVYVKFKLDDNSILLAWTTTPWTLPANTALAVNDKLDYVEVELVAKSKKVYLISGKHAYASREYFPRLKQNLESQGFDVTIIDHIDPASPQLDVNVNQLSRYDFNNAQVITHSLGAPTFLKWLSAHDETIGSLTMIAPSYPGVSIGSSNVNWTNTSGYVGFELDFNDIRRKIATQPTIIYSDDLALRNDSFARLGEQLRANMVYEAGKGHFFDQDQTREPDFEFQFNERFILAKELLGKVLQDEKHQPLAYNVIRELKGKELVGKHYEPLLGMNRGEGAHVVLAADYVSHEDGTGIVHIAPAYGEEDFALAREHKIPVVHTIDENGDFTESDWTGANVWEVNKQIAKDLKERGIVWKVDYIRHSYPHCHRCGTKLMYRAHPSWFMDIDGQREMMLEKNEPITWFPEHVKEGRFAKTVEQAPDWNISRDRFWATAMPVWKGTDADGKEHVRVVGSYAELKELSGVELDDYHRPWVDDITFTIDGVEYTRTDKVMDSWFEAGSMPFAQFHYPFESKEKFEANFPGDFIVEYIGQVRAWFYYMHAMSVALFGENSFKNVIVTGNVAGNDGRKMSKSYGNYTDPNELMDKYSADSLRFLLLSSPLLNGEDFALHDKEVGDVARKLGMIWNMYDFFTMYAEVDGWEYDGQLTDPLADVTNPLDIWIISRLHQLVAEVERHMDGYNIPDAMSPILPFLDDASNWYVRRSRRRFWKSEDDGDKNDAYRTLHYVLVRLAYLLAPFTPFLAEELYHNLTGDNESVHLMDWMAAGDVNRAVLDEMAYARELINIVLSQRAERGPEYKVRQRLAGSSHIIQRYGINLQAELKSMIVEETNISFEFAVNEDSELPHSTLAVDWSITNELKREGIMREIVRYVQSARKKAGLNVDDRIELVLTTDSDDLRAAIDEHRETIQAETLAVSLDAEGAKEYEESVTVEGAELNICLAKS